MQLKQLSLQARATSRLARLLFDVSFLAMPIIVVSARCNHLSTIHGQDNSSHLASTYIYIYIQTIDYYRLHSIHILHSLTFGLTAWGLCHSFIFRPQSGILPLFYYYQLAFNLYHSHSFIIHSGWGTMAKNRAWSRRAHVRIPTPSWQCPIGGFRHWQVRSDMSRSKPAISLFRTTTTRF